MHKIDAALYARIGTDNQDRSPKEGRNPISSTMTTQERAQIVAALAAANAKTGLFPKK